MCGSTRHAVVCVEQEFRIARCAECSFVFLGNPPDDAGLYDGYHGGSEPDPSAYAGDSPISELRELYAINRQRCAWVNAETSGRTLLDIGCGRGYFVHSALRHGYAGEGIDIAESAVRYAHDRMNIPVTRSTIESVADAGRKFDIVTLWHVLEHFVNPGVALTAVRSLLAPGGQVFLEVPNWNSLKFALSGRRWEGGNHPKYHRSFFTPSTLRRCLTTAGFSAVRRSRLSYAIPGKSPAYRIVKLTLNQFGRDAFLDFSARK